MCIQSQSIHREVEYYYFFWGGAALYCFEIYIIWGLKAAPPLAGEPNRAYKLPVPSIRRLRYTTYRHIGLQ